MNFVSMTVNNSRNLLQNNRLYKSQWSIDFIQFCVHTTDTFKESATAWKNHIVSPDHRKPAKCSSNNPLIIFHEK